MSLLLTILVIGVLCWLIYLPEVPVHAVFKKLFVALCVLYCILLIASDLGAIHDPGLWRLR